MDSRLTPGPSKQTAALAPGEARPGAFGPADAQCIREVLAGKRERFEELVRRYQDAVYGVALAYTREPHRAQDLTQETFLSAFTGLSQLRDPHSFLPWLLQIVRHRAVREAGKEAARPEQPLTPTSEPAAAEAQSDERWAEVLGCVEDLEEPYRHTLLLKYRQGLSCKEIAVMDGISIGTVTSRLARALAVLRLILKPPDRGETP